jgi:hypothetical protein
VRALLEYSQSVEGWLPYGLSLVAGVVLTELLRSWSLALMWAVNYRTAARLRGAALTFAFHKILRLRNTKDISPGEVGRSQQIRSILLCHCNRYNEMKCYLKKIIEVVCINK